MYQSIKYNLFIFILSVILPTTAFSQEKTIIKDFPCGEEMDTYDMTETSTTKQSTTNGSHSSFHATDGDYSNASLAETKSEGNAWLEIELEKPSNVKELKIWYPSDKPLGKFYVLLSSVPFESGNLANELVFEGNDYVFVQAIESGKAIPIDRSGVKFIRIQKENDGVLSLIEVEVPGVGEICDNGEDDDCDGLVDCEDSDCSGFINPAGNVAINPTCPICEDGEIHIYGMAYNQMFVPGIGMMNNVTEYSIDGGQTWQLSRDFYNLDEGYYYAWIRNVVTNCLVENPTNPIILVAPLGLTSADCPNGDFEDGDFTGWTGGLGEVTNPLTTTYPNSNEDFDDPTDLNSRHRILLSNGYTDPNVPDLDLSPPITGSGSYMVRLGNNESRKEAEKLTYCFEVTPDNADFHFNYAAVLEDPGHSNNENPFLRYKIFAEGNPSNVICQFDPIIANVNDELFTEYDPGSNMPPVAYKGFTCESCDLATQIGNKVCVEFETADCARGQHFGYAYINGVCSNSQEQTPVAVINANPTICINSLNYLVDGSMSYGENQYTWTVCKVNPNGFEFGCKSKGFFNNVGTLDIREFYEEFGGFFECDAQYKVKLEVSNDCGNGEPVEKDIFISCGKHIDYEDIVYCTNELKVPVVGENNCSTCTYEWVALTGDPVAFDDPTTAFPNIINFPQGSGTSRSVAVTATDATTGCVYYDEITVTKFDHEPSVNLTFIDEVGCSTNSNTSCELIFFAKIETELDFEELFIELINETTGTIFNNFELTSSEIASFPETINTYSIRCRLSGFDEGVTDESTYKITVGFEEYMNINNVGCIAEDQVTIGDLNTWGDIPLMFFPNAFSPNGDGANDLWVVNPPASTGYNVTWYKLQIWNEWGGLLYEIEECAPSQNGFPLGSINWDGNAANGDPLNTDWYIYLINFENCNNERASAPTFPLVDSNHPCPGDPSINCWYGEINLLR